MNDEFAKLYGEGGDQILFTREKDDHGNAAVRIAFLVPSLRYVDFLSVWFTYDNKADRDKAWKKVNATAARMTLKKMRNMYASAKPLSGVKAL